MTLILSAYIPTLEYMNEFTPALAERIATRFRVLGDPTRIRILHAVQERERTVGGLAELLGVNQASMSKHLAILRDEGLLQAERRGTQVILTLKDASLMELCTLVCAGVRRTAEERLTALNP